MNNNGQEINNKPNKIICKPGNWLVLLMLILTKEKEEKLSNMPNLTSLLKTEDSQYLMLLAIKTTSQTWLWAPVKLISLFLLSLLNKVNSKPDSIKKVKPKNTLCWQKLWVYLDFWWLLQKWVLKIGLNKDSMLLKIKLLHF